MIRKLQLITMSENDYESIMTKIHDLEMDLYCAQLDRDVLKMRCDSLYDLLNRPAIEMAAENRENEFYEWCSKMADKYNKFDEEEWMLDRARFYNNGKYEYAKNNNLPLTCEAVSQHVKDYEDYLFSDDPSWNDLHPKTEGWSDVPRYSSCGGSFILSHARDDAWERYEAHRSETGYAEGPYWEIVKSFDAMKEEGKSVDPDYGGFYR